MNKHHQEYARDQDETRDPCLQDRDVQNFMKIIINKIMNKHHQEYARDQDETRDPCLQD